jgi:methionine-rich copper-binding protein CopC
MRRIALAISICAMAAALATAAQAHTHLVSATPADKAVVAAPPSVALHFSEGLEGRFSSAKLSHDGMPVAVTSEVSGKDRKTIIAVPKTPLAAGAYEVSWQAVAADGHKMTGAYAFTVK